MPRSSTRIDPQTVITAAADLADAAGSIESVTLVQVAEIFGMRVPSLYNYVDGLAGLRRGVALLGLRELNEQIRNAAVGRTAADALLAVAHSYRGYAHAHPGRYTASLQARLDDADISAVGAQIVGLLVQLLEPYRLSEDDALHAVRGLRSIIHGFVTLEAAGAFGLDLDRDTSFTRLVTTFVDGLGLGRRMKDEG
jgi:hypothetical protein